MNRSILFLSGVVLGAWLLMGTPAVAYVQHTWYAASPDHGQTFSYGSEQHRQWMLRGNHLALWMEFTNDPYVDRNNPRQYDYFTFNFPQVRLGSDGRTFYFHAKDGRSLPVAQKHSGFLGIEEIRLTPSCDVSVGKHHGYLSVVLMIQDHPFPSDDN